MCRIRCLLLLSFAVFLPGIHCFTVLYDLIYEELKVNSICFRRLNGTHSIGCQSNENGNIGFVQLVERDEDVEWILLNKHRFPIIAVMAFEQFTPSILLKLQRTNSVVGVLLFRMESESLLNSGCVCDRHCYSKDQDDEESNSNCFWNSQNLVLRDFSFPIFIITDKSQIEAVVQCFKRYGRKDTTDTIFSAFCGIELKARMFASMDTVSCLRKNQLNEQSFSNSLVRVTTKIPMFCKPLRSFNAFATLFETSSRKELKNRSMIVVTSRMDSLSMFDDLTPPDNSVVNSLIVFLSVVKTLSILREEIRLKAKEQNILFALFEGEAFDFIGSSRTAYEMINSNGLKPMEIFRFKNMKPAVQRLHHWSHFIEIQQLSSRRNSHLWVHSPTLYKSQDPKLLNNFIDVFTSISKELNISVTSTDKHFPTSSANSFLKHDSQIKTTLLTNYENCYKNNHFNSFSCDLRDSEYKQNIMHLTKLSTLVSKSLYKMITNEESNVSADDKVVELLHECFLQNSSCRLFKEVKCIGDRLLREGRPFPLYTSVSTFAWHQILVQCLHDLFAYFTAIDFLKTNESECRRLRDKEGSFTYDWMNGPHFSGVCVKSTRFITPALSPAFTSKTEDLNSSEYSTWTESVWQKPSARIFLIGSDKQQWTMFIFGFLITLFSVISLCIFNFEKFCICNVIE